MTQVTAPSAPTQTDIGQTLAEGIQAIMDLMYPPPATREQLFPEMVRICDELTTNLTSYAFYDEKENDEAYTAIEKAHRLLARAKPLLGQPMSPQGHSDPGDEDDCPCCGDFIRPGHICQ